MHPWDRRPRCWHPRLLEDQATTRLQDTLKNVPGINLNAGEGSARGDTVNIRGFAAFNDFFLDGTRDAAIYSRDKFRPGDRRGAHRPFRARFNRWLEREDVVTTGT